MVERNNFKMLSDEEASWYKFDFCKNCRFYECELVEEYTQFRENHAQDHKEQIPLLTEDGRCVGTVTYMQNIEQYNDAEAGATEAHSYIFDEDAFSYDQSKLKDGCFMSGRYVDQVECGRKTVTEGIGDHYKIEIDCNGNIKEKIEDRWESLQPVFISAQTGQGKNYFIENKLIPYVEQLNYENQKKQRVLILSNRLALKQQIKYRLNGNEGSDDENGTIYSYKENVDVMTYQSLLCRKKYLEKWQKDVKKRYIYVICDEAHFFTSDAMFNPHTQKILQTIVRLFQDAVRIYMSATSYECLEYIIKYEDEEQTRLNLKQYGKDQCNWKTGRMIFYHFKRDYSYLDVKTYSKIKELYGEIVESVNQRKEKWLIFIDDKKKCVRIKEKLEKLIEDKKYPVGVEDDEVKNKVKKVYAVDANSKERSTYQGIVKNERLNKDTYVLISTSVLDNGINLKGIRNIVVSDMTKTKCLQMVGRARVEGDIDRKNLYIKRFDVDEVEKRITELKKQRKAYNSYEAAYGKSGNELYPEKYREYEFLNKYYNGKEKDWRDAKRWFGRTIEEEPKLYLNKIAKSMMERLIPQYQCILDEMSDEKSKEDKVQDSKCISHMGQKYLEYQLSWFGKKYCEDDDITFANKEKTKNELIAFLKTHAEKRTEFVSEEEMAGFTKKFIEIFDAAFGKSDKNSRQYGVKKMNKMLEEQNIGYEIDGKPQVGPWKVISRDR